jgi:PAS domain S-box-containing protein
VTDELRTRAERRVLELGNVASAASGRASSGESELHHDLRVHQVELEMQNEELRAAEVKLEASRARYFDLYDVAPVGYCSISEAGVILEANLTAATLLGVPRGALVERRMTRFLASEDQDRYYLLCKRLFATGAPQVINVRMRREDGTQFWARLEAATAPGADGGTEVCRVVLSDITDQKRVEEERLQLELELQRAQKAESLARMAGAIAHHFNNQLAVVMSNLELSGAEAGVDSPYLSDAMLATRKAAEVSGLLLTYVGQSSGNHAPLDFSEACAGVLPLLRAAIPAHVELRVDLAKPGPAVNGNPNQLQLMVTNLVTNAWEAVGDLEATVQVTVRTVRGSQISTSHRFAAGWAPGDQDYACLEVTDSGCGIAPQDIDTIFEPFFTTKLTGRGLGLPVVLGILHAHSGGLVVESRRGHHSGSTFRVYLPVSAEQVARPAIAADVEDSSETLWSGTALLVEDDQLLRRAAASTLGRLGFVVLQARDGVEAMDLFRRHRDTIRLVLCDLTMPHIDGWETLAALRRASPGIRVILTSGYDEADVMADDHDEQPNAFLAKPYPIDALRHAIRRALGTARPPR